MYKNKNIKNNYQNKKSYLNSTIATQLYFLNLHKKNKHSHDDLPHFQHTLLVLCLCVLFKSSVHPYTIKRLSSAPNTR